MEGKQVTVNQLTLLTNLHKERKMEFDPNNIETQEEADVLIKSILSVPKSEEKPVKEVNEIVLGMCFKKAIDMMLDHHQSPVGSPDDFKEVWRKTVELYKYGFGNE